MDKRQTIHLLRRTLFGAKKSEVVHFSAMNIEEAVNVLLTLSSAPETPVNDYTTTANGISDLHVPFGRTWIYAPHAGDNEDYRIRSLKSWLINNILQQEANIQEKMIFFWHNLLVTKVWDVYIAKASYHYFEVLRANALGNFKTLIKAITLDPAMLIFLNGAANVKEAPDENYARELQELFCIGKGPDSQYTESDVQAAARVLTGWQINWEAYNHEGSFKTFFSPDQHDITDKQFSAFYGNKIIPGKSGEEGAKELDELLDMIIENEETAKYICRRIYSFFVSSNIDEIIEEEIISPLAEIFRANNYEVLPVLTTLLKSEHFFDASNKGILIKSPADHLLGLWRTLEVSYPNEDDLLMNFRVHGSLLWRMASLGLEMGDPPNVAGWPAYYQAPQFDKAWITTDTITQRASLADSLLFWGFWVSDDIQIKADLISFVQKLTYPSDPALLIDEAATLFLGLEVSENVRNDLKSILLSGQLDDHYWTSAWNNYLENPANEENRYTVESRLQATFQRLFQLGEFQLM